VLATHIVLKSDRFHLGASQVAVVLKNTPTKAGDIRDAGLIPESRRSPEEGMATHSSILAWRIPWIEEPGRLQSIVSQRVRHNLISAASVRSIPFLSFMEPIFA